MYGNSGVCMKSWLLFHSSVLSISVALLKPCMVVLRLMAQSTKKQLKAIFWGNVQEREGLAEQWERSKMWHTETSWPWSALCRRKGYVCVSVYVHLCVCVAVNWVNHTVYGCVEERRMTEWREQEREKERRHSCVAWKYMRWFLHFHTPDPYTLTHISTPQSCIVKTHLAYVYV